MRSLLVVAVLLAGCRRDRDGDGFVGRDDCDDRDPAIFPAADERCNGVDDDCDGEVDEAGDVVPSWLDQDGDGYGGGVARRQCPIPDDHVLTGGDCDDTRPDVFPGAGEACDGVDQDCDGLVDEEPDPPPYVDDDGDGFGDPAKPVVDCEPFVVGNAGDCDDGDDTVFPGAPERCNGQDDDCDGFVEEDRDADGSPECLDCDDRDPTRSPLVREVCNGVDDDCDDVVDGVGTWLEPDALARVRVPVDLAGDAPLVALLDARAALDAEGVVVAFDPARLVAVWQDCDQRVELPVAWVEDEAWAVGGHDDAAEVGAVVVLYDTDGDLDTVEPWPGAGEVGLYLGVDPGQSWVGGVQVQDETLSAAGLELSVDPARGGLAELGDDDGIRWSQAAATAGNGIRTADGPLSAQDVPGTVAVASGSVTAALSTTVTLANDAGGIEASWVWRRFAGREEVWVLARFVTDRTTQLEGVSERTETVRPWQAVVPGSEGVSASKGLGSVTVGGADIAWNWMVPPEYLTHIGFQGDEVWAAGNEVSDCCQGPSGTVGGDVALLDGVVWQVGTGPEPAR